MTLERQNWGNIVTRDTLCVEKKYSFVKPIGMGAFKETFLVSKGSQPLALKIIDPQKINSDRYRAEIKALSCCKSDRISRLIEFDAFCYEEEKIFYFFEEYIGGGTLTDKLNASKFSLSDVKPFTLSVLEAIHCLKENRMVHRDIKPENIMYREDDPLPVLVDFGLVRDLSASSLTPSYIAQGPGTPFFSAPEQLNNEKQLIDWKTDQFSLGLVLAFSLTGRHPYDLDGGNAYMAVSRVMERKSCAPWFVEYAQEAGVHFILNMIEPWSIRRYTDIDTFRSILERMEV